MAQQHRNPQEQENQQQSRWRDRVYGNPNEDERNRDWEDRWGQGGYGQSQYGQREQGGYGGGTSYGRGGFRGEQERSYGEFRESGRSPSSQWRPEES